MSQDFWTTARTTILLLRYEALASYGVIALELHCTRSAVAGKVGRLHLPRRGPPVLSLPNPSNMPGRKRKKLREDEPAADEVEPLILIEETGRECNIFELDRHRCRFPLGEPRTPGFHFCGQTPKSSSPYCERHHKLTHVKTKKLRLSNIVTPGTQ